MQLPFVLLFMRMSYVSLPILLLLFYYYYYFIIIIIIITFTVCHVWDLLPFTPNPM